nr:MAG TPA: portal [Bacteriophage sp.]
MNRKKKNSPKQGKIIQGGMLVPQGMRQPDIVLQMPEIFMFDMNAYMQSVKAAKGIDFSNRARLYDMYDSASLDLHLSGVIAKRMRGVTKIPIEFRRNGVPDDEINKQIKSPWFKQLRKDLVMSEFWGFTLVQFYRNDEGNIRYDLINRKHYDPIHRKLLKYQGSMDGVPIDDFPDMLFVGSERDLGIYAELLPAVLYKRGDMSDWAQFCNIFGMPVREYTYDAGDEEARRRVIADAHRQGANTAYIHPKESELKLVEAGNKTGSSDLYRTFAEYWDSKMSIRVLGNTLTTDAKSTGTQALGSVHKEEEDEMNSDDRDFILDILNYDMRPIFASLGFNVEGGEFVYAKKDKINPAQQIDIVQKLSSMGLPIDDDYLYETFCVAKPDNYKQLKEEKEAAKAAFREQLGLQVNDDDKKKQDKNTDKTAFKQHLRSFFGLAPQHNKGANF